nr:hypothetical protein GCM10020092_070020 [Actinoplanes digitatis]
MPGALNGVQDVAISPDGRHVYAAGATSSTITALSRDPGTGVLSALAAPNRCLYHSAATAVTGCASGRVLDGAGGVAVSPDGAFVYVASSVSDSVTVFARDSGTGALTQLAGTAGCVTNSAVGGCATGKGLNGAAYLHLSPDGGSLYVASSGSNAVAVFQRDAGTGVLTQPSGAERLRVQQRLHRHHRLHGRQGPHGREERGDRARRPHRVRDGGLR